VASVDLRHLRALVAVVDAGGFARAGARLHVSQPALSRQIALLEHELRVRLFDRLGRRVQLTADGEAVLGHARRVLDEADALGERARTLTGGDAGVLRVGATPQTIESLLAPFLVHHRRRHPGVDVHLLEDGGARLPARLERGELHAALIPVPDGRFPGRVLFPVYVLAVVPPTHRLARRPAVEITELADTPLLLLRREFGSRRWFDAACQAAHLRPRVVLESAAPHTVLALAEAGYGVAVVPSNVRLPPTGFRAAVIVHRKVPLAAWVAVAWHAPRVLPRYAERFVAELAAYTRRSYPGRALTRHAPPVPRPSERVWSDVTAAR
jgi:LysR family cyn operon transcriptional activator